MDTPPDKLKYAAIAQIVSGLVNLTITWWLAASVGFMVCQVGTAVLSVLSFGLCGIVGCLGVFASVSFLALPLGLLEIVSGIVGLTNPKGGGTLMKITAVFEVLGTLVGALPGTVAGGLVLMFLSDEQVRGYLEAP